MPDDNIKPTIPEIYHSCMRVATRLGKHNEFISAYQERRRIKVITTLGIWVPGITLCAYRALIDIAKTLPKNENAETNRARLTADSA